MNVLVFDLVCYLFIFGLYGLPFLNLDEFLIIQVSKDIKYADKQPIIPWGPRYSKSSRNDMLINLVIATVFSAWIAIQRSVEYKPLHTFISNINEEGAENGRGLRMGKRLLLSLSLVFGSILFASLAYTGILNVIEYMGSSIAIALYNQVNVLAYAHISLHSKPSL
ncbi:hypothetical protein HID58_080766 [Brassica napus]|uniref:Uncharacterized protein n=1 Tax=Brassica napus TaxID=3708 RepID=A0ABQ7Y5U2_BRANA|nr:hypothetical protein HID58_080766 [Brassica napus]